MKVKLKVFRAIELIVVLSLLLEVNSSISQSILNNEQTIIYLIPGQGSDYRIFNNLQLPEKYDTVHVKHIIPLENESMNEYAFRLSKQINTTQNYSIIGVSLGGMVATELAEILIPEKVIAISSAKHREEIPGRYTFMKTIPIYKLLPAILYKYGSYIAQPLFEPDRNKEKETCKAMLQAKDPVFLKRATHMIVNWKRESYASNVYHIHGTNDHTLPYRNTDPDFTIENGSHMMTLVMSEKINSLIISILEDK